MKKTILLLLLVINTALFSTELNWSNDYQKALKEAKLQNKDIYLFVGADKCKFCDRFKATALQNNCVLKRLEERYIMLYMSRDQHNVPAQYATKGVPRHYFLTADEKIFFQTWGGRDIEGFKLVLDEAELNRDSE